MIIKSIQPVCVLGRTSDPFPDDLPQIAFSGRSNVGKSSLINRLTGRSRLAKISSTPGKTRKIHFFRINDLFYLVDLPGYGYTRLPVQEKLKWRKLVENYLEKSKNLKAVVSLVDIRHKPFPTDREMLAYLADLAVPALVVLTKADKLSANGRRKMIDAFFAEIDCLSPDQVVVASARSGMGCDQLLEAIGELIAPEGGQQSARENPPGSQSAGNQRR